MLIPKWERGAMIDTICWSSDKRVFLALKVRRCRWYSPSGAGCEELSRPSHPMKGGRGPVPLKLRIDFLSAFSTERLQCRISGDWSPGKVTVTAFWRPEGEKVAGLAAMMS